MNEITQIFLRSIFAFGLAFIMARLLGRKLISQMTFFDFLVGISLGTLTASLALGTRYTIAGAMTGLVTFSLLTITMGFLSIKSFKARKLFESEPVVVVSNGRIVDQNMKKIRYDLDSLMMHLRHKNVFNVGDVEFAILETDGKISVELKSQKQPVTPSDLNIPTQYKGLMKELIVDGNVMEENLTKINLSKEWLEDKLKNKGINSPNVVFFAGLDTTGNLYVSQKFEREEDEGQYGIE